MYGGQHAEADFNPRSPHGERLPIARCARSRSVYFNPRSPHGERPVVGVADGVAAVISTHAPRTGSDARRRPREIAVDKFQPTLPARGATITTAVRATPAIFQPTLPARGATGASGFPKRHSVFQPTLPARGATGRSSRDRPRFPYFNPRSPHGERRRWKRQRKMNVYFNPRSPHGERHVASASGLVLKVISTHAPRTGSDCQHPINALCAESITTHAPRRGCDLRHPCCGYACHISTHAPRTGSDEAIREQRRASMISTHAPRTGSDKLHASCVQLKKCHFNPRSPHGERRQPVLRFHPLRHFNPRSPHGERQKKCEKGLAQITFQPTLPARGATGTEKG